MNSTRRTNRLERETGDEAFAKARSEDKPVLREHAR